MSRWNVQDGLIHFLFANEDRYILDSMIALDLAGYLNYELHRRHFQRILFIKGLQGSYTVRVFNKDTWEWAAEQTKSLFGLGLRSKAEFRPVPGGQTMTCPAEQIRKLPAQAEKTAFVFALDSFAEIFRGCAEELENWQKKNGHTKNLLLLRAGVMAEDSQPILQDPEGIFQAGTAQGYLFPEIVTAFREENGAEEGCYKRMKQILGDRCIFLNCFSRKAINRTIRYADWIGGKGLLSRTGRCLEQETEYIWKWYHDAGEQAERRGLFSDNPARSYQVLLRDLTRFGKAIREVAEEAPSGLPEKLLEDPGVITDSLFVRQVPDLPLFEQKDQEKRKEFLAGCDRVRRKLRIPQAAKPQEEAQKYLKRFLDRMTIAVKSGDIDTFRRTEAGIGSVADGWSMEEEDAQILWKYHDMLTGESLRLFEIQGILRSNTKRLERVKQDLFQMAEQDFESFDSTERAKAASRFMSLQNEMDALKGLISKNTKEEADITGHLLQMEKGVEVWKQKQSEEGTQRTEQALQALLNTMI